MVASALARLPAGFEVDVVIYDDGLSRRTCAELERIVSLAKTISRFRLERGFSQRAERLPVAGHVNESMYSRLLIPDLSPTLERAVYIDADMLVLDDISELFTFDLDGAIFAAAVDKYTPTLETGLPYSFETLGLPPNRHYFNSGLLAIDVAAWRAAGISAATADYVRRWDAELRCPDQDGINAVSGERALALDRRFHFQVSGEALGATASGGDLASAHRDRRQAAVIHFTGPKPWLTAWFGSTIWTRTAGLWWCVALRSPLISPRHRLRLLAQGAQMVTRGLRTRVVRREP
jgi:lipopolysaccharide biosynthesis glycosyltransferase